MTISIRRVTNGDMAGYLIHMLKCVRQEGIREPDAVQEKTLEYREENDEWIEYRKLTLSKNPSCCVQWADLKGNFLEWYSNTYGQKCSHKISDIKKYFVNYLGFYKDTTFNNDKLRGFSGWKFIKYTKKN